MIKKILGSQTKIKNMKHYSFIALVAALFFLFIPVFSQSQFKGFSINPKTGIFFGSDNINGAVLGVETNYLTNGWIFSVDFFQFQEILLTLRGSDEDFFNQVGFMAGKYYGDRLFRVQFQGGIAAVREMEIPEDRFFTMGLVLKTGFKFIPLHFFSIGLDLQGNINSEKPLFMPLVSIEFGRLRDPIKK